MSSSICCSRVWCWCALAGLVVLGWTGLGPPLAAQETTSYVYSLNQHGKVSVNGVRIESLPGSFDVHDDGDDGDAIEDGDERWWDMAVLGSDRFMLRRDGRVQKNGKKLVKLPKSTGDPWVSIIVTDNGSFYALRKDGPLWRDGLRLLDRHAGDLDYVDLATDGVSVFTLKTDGKIYRDEDTAPLLHFMGPGEEGTVGNQWRILQFHPDGRLFGLRRDGIVVSADVPATVVDDPPNGSMEANLPEDASNKDEYYRGFSFDADGTWYAVRRDGRLYSSLSSDSALVNLPGSGSSDGDRGYVDCLVTDGRVLSLRGDGRLYVDTGPKAVVNLVKDRYRRLVVSDAPPILSKKANKRPVVTTYRVKANVGDALSIPVIVTDVDQPSDELVLTPDVDTLPAGAVWDAETRRIEWPDAGPAGHYTVVVRADDGVNKPAVGRFRIRVEETDTSPVNRKPSGAKIRRARAFIGIDLELPILVHDRDGDALIVSVDTSKGPLPPGASFDPQTRVLRWAAPGVEEAGRHRFTFLIDDGTSVGRLRVKLRVVGSLLAF